MTDFKSVGAYRHHYRSPGDLRRAAKFRYELCDSCQGIFQSLEVENRTMGLGSYSTRYPTIEETINFNRENEKNRRTFRLVNSRCRCDAVDDKVYSESESGLRELKKRQDDFARQDLPSDGWYIDPSNRHEYRFWDGAQWTGHISNQGIASFQPIVVPNDWWRVLPGNTQTTVTTKSSTTSAVPRKKRTKGNITEQLGELVELHRSGALTSEQFEAAKNALLGID